MAEAKQDEAAKAAEPAADAERYDRTGWIERAQGYFAVRRHTMAGALTLLDRRKHTFTRDEVAAAIDEYRAREA